MNDFDCSCPQCLNNDAPDTHEICCCYDCHDADCHEVLKAWAEVCLLCAEAMKDLED